MLEQNAVHLASPDTYIKYAIQMSVCPSVRHTFFTMFPSSYHHEFSGVMDRSDVHAKGQGQMSKVKVTEVNTQLRLFPDSNSSLNSHMAMKSWAQLEAE